MGCSSNLFDTQVIFSLVISIITFGTMWSDVFILAVNCGDWMKKKYLSLADKIMTLQGSIRICFGCESMLWCILATSCPGITQRDYVLKGYMFGAWYFISCNLWLRASLCSYYCVKIADFRHPFFIRLKLRLSGLVSTWLLGSLVMSLASSVTYACSDFEIQDNRNLSHLFSNKNVTVVYQKRMASHVTVLLGLGFLTAFAICATSAILLLFSLWRHRQRMLGSWDGHRSPQTDAHFQALIIILSLLVNNIITFISVILILSGYSGRNYIINIVAIGFLCCCFSVESLISLWGNKKLRNELRKALYFAKCRGHAT